VHNGQSLIGIRIYLRGGAIISAVHSKEEVEQLFSELKAVDRGSHFEGDSRSYGVSAPAFNWIVNADEIVGMNTFILPPPEVQVGAQAPLPPGASGIGPTGFPRMYN
jgi:hypothetical protein